MKPCVRRERRSTDLYECNKVPFSWRVGCQLVLPLQTSEIAVGNYLINVFLLIFRSLDLTAPCALNHVVLNVFRKRRISEVKEQACIKYHL